MSLGEILGGIFTVMGAILAALFFMVLGSLISGFILMLAWNYAMPDLFDFLPLQYWQSFCLVLIAAILVKSSHYSN